MNVRKWLEKLVSFDTTSRNSNLELIHYCKDYLEGLGVHCTLILNPENTKANLWATLPGEGGVTEGGVILSGHTDVVPVDGQKWDSDPFMLTERDGKLYGRGTCDMKGFIAVCMSLTPEFLRMRRAKPIHYAWTYDEEVGCLGGKVLTEYLRKHNIKADGCIVGEPTSNKMVVAHKGICVYRARFYGKGVHSSLALTEHGCNAIDYAARLVVKVREIAEDLKGHGLQDSFFDVPFTTVSTNLIQGGNAMNTVPALCEVVYEMRFLPTAQADLIQQMVQAFVDNELLPSMKREFSEGRIELENLASVPSFKDPDENDSFLLLLRHLTNDTAVHKVAYGTEAGQYQGIGMLVILCGPGSIFEAHKANEFVSLEQLNDSVRIVRAVAQSKWLMAPSRL